MAEKYLRNSLKHLYKAEPVGRILLLEAGVTCNSKAELFQTSHDARMRLAPAMSVRCSNLKHLVASQGCRNQVALARSLSEECFEASEILVGRFRDCIGEPRSIRLVTHNSDLILETSAIHDILDPDLVDSDHLTTTRRQILRFVRSYPVIDEDVLFAFNSFTLSYGHYLLTSLPLIFAFEREIKEGLLKIVVPAGFPRWMRDHLLEFGIDESRFLVLRDSAYRFRSAIVSNILDARNTRAPNPYPLAFVDRLGSTVAIQSTGTKLFVRRSGASDLSSRTIANEDEVISALEALGFRVIEPGKMSLREQVDAFYQAEVVVSPHGSTLANLLFCRPGTKILDLMPDDWVGARGDALRDVWGMRICALAKLQYSILLCPSQIVARHYTGNPVINYNVVLADLIASVQRL
jgi:capsular polysaccharide biosynthesis protein